MAIRPGYWQPAQFAAAAAILDQLSGGRLLINIVAGIDDLGAYGDVQSDPARRYDRTLEFLRLVRRLWRGSRPWRRTSNCSGANPWTGSPSGSPGCVR